MIHPNVFFNLLLGCSSVVYGRTSNVSVTLFVADNTSMCVFGSDGAGALIYAWSLVRCGSHQFVFSCLEVLLKSTLPLCAISCKALQGHSVVVDSLHISYADISWVRAVSCSPPKCQLTVEDVFWNATILHMVDMTQPSQSALSKQSVHTGNTNMRHAISVGYFILPGYAPCTADASRWNVLSLLSRPAYVVHVSLSYSNVLITQALYTAIFVFTDSLGLVHARAVRRARVETAFPILNCRSLRPRRGCQ